MFALSRPRISWLLTISALLLFGCGKGSETLVQPPPPEVTISLPEKRQVTDHLEFTGNTQALESVEIRARVQGFLDRMNFQPGQKVKAGDLLFVIDPRPPQARVDQVEASLKGKQADLKLKQANLKRAQQLVSSASISQLQYEVQLAEESVAVAQVGITKADLEEARLQLDYTQVKSPINGLVDRNLVDLGTLVGAQDKTLLTTVVNDESVYVYFNISENDLLMLMRNYGTQRDPEMRHKPQLPCSLALADETDFARKGTIDFVGTEVDPKTGTLSVRALFPNKDGFLLKGMFVRVRVPLRERDALLVPNLSVGLDQAGRYVLVVNKDNVVEQRQVEIGQQEDRFRVIEKGLTKDEWVITNGMQRARPGSKVTPIRESQSSPGSAGSSQSTTGGK
jgi:multidrug efflux system membrane fusion protein